MRSTALILCLALSSSLACDSRAIENKVDPIEVSAERPWPQWRGIGRDGKSGETGLLSKWPADGPPVVWKTKGLGKGYANVSVADGKLFTTGNQSDGQAVVTISADDGKVLWKKTLTNSVPKHGYGGSRCTPTVDGDRLYVVTSDGAIACLTIDDGSIVWQKSFRDEWKGKMMSGWGFSESPLVDGDWVLCTPGGSEALMVALDKKTGKEIWRTAASDLGKSGKDGAGYSSIVVSNAVGVKQYVQLTGRGLIGVDAKTGKLLWNYNRVANGTANIPTPVVDGDFVFGSSGYGTGSVLLEIKKDGDKLIADEKYFLDAKTLQNHHGGMILLGKYLFCGHGHNKGFPICVELATGDIVWGPERGKGSGSAAVSYADGHLYFRYQDGTMVLIEADPNDYKVKGEFKIGILNGKSWAHPVIADGRLYLRDQDELIVYDIQAKK
ncbi:MAG: PQQ-like beta-propeller repeat protein [Pirellulales bacterium]|nr:PQQ-like beta-propeller repeat protein [Pirellulales bacterium]